MVVLIIAVNFATTSALFPHPYSTILNLSLQGLKPSLTNAVDCLLSLIFAARKEEECHGRDVTALPCHFKKPTVNGTLKRGRIELT